MNKQSVILFLKSIQDDTRLHGNRNLALIQSACKFINSLFCDCKYVEYWVLDMNFGTNITNTEMGYELVEYNTIEKFVDFLFSRYVN